MADALSAASPQTDPATAAAVARHSVRMVREERMADYARTVSRNAKRWLADAQRRLDAHMAAHGYTERVWHGTAGGEFNEFRFATRGEIGMDAGADGGIRMAFFSYQEKTAENYAALNSYDIDTDYETVAEGKSPDVRQYYINPGKCLELDDKASPTTYVEWTRQLKKAYDEGYDSVRCLNAIDDTGARLPKREGDPMEWVSDVNEYGEEYEDGFRTDILVVFDRPGNPGANRVKAADPVTFMDDADGGLPVPLEMRADQSLPDVRYSVAMGNRAREEARRMIMKYRPLGATVQKGSYTWERYHSQLESVVSDIASFDTPKERKAALYWYCKGTIGLPEDASKVIEAIKTAERAKVDPFAFDRPGEILARFSEFRPKEPPLDPDTVAEFSDRRELGEGVVTYLVDDTREGQQAVRRAINTHWGKDANPWCLAQGDRFGHLTDAAWRYWERFDTIPKRIAFKDGRLTAFMASENNKESWWDREDNRHKGVTFGRKVAAPDGRGDAVQTCELDTDGTVSVLRTERGNAHDPDGTVETWFPNGRYRMERRTNGITSAETEIDENGTVLRVLESESLDTGRTLHKKMFFNADGSLRTAEVSDIDHYFDFHRFAASGNMVVEMNCGDTVGHRRYDGIRLDDSDIVQKVEEFREAVKNGDVAALREIARVFAESAAPTTRYSVGVRRAMQDIADGRGRGVIHNPEYGDIDFPLGSFGRVTPNGNIRHGLGLLHIVFARMAKEGASLDDAVQTAIEVADAAEGGVTTRDEKNRLWLDRNGLRAVVAKNADGKKVITGYEIYADEPKVTNRASFGSDNLPTPRSEDVLSALKSRLASLPEATSDNIPYPAPSAQGGVESGVNRHGERYSVRAVGKYAGELRRLAWGLKLAHHRAMEDAARLMAPLIPDNAVIVPMPNHGGKPVSTMLLAYYISGEKDGADVEVVPALEAEPHESNYRHKKRVGKSAEIVMHRTDAAIEPGRPVVVIDNVVASGATYRAAQKVLPEADLVTLADATRGRVDFDPSLQDVHKAMAEDEAVLAETPDKASLAPADETPEQAERVRHSVRRGTPMSGEDIATALLAARRLAGKDVPVDEADRLIKSMGVTDVRAPDLVARANALADRNREKMKDAVERSEPSLFAALAREGMMERAREAIDRAIAGGASAADPEVGRMVQKAIESKRTRDLMAAKGFTAARLMAECPIDLPRALLAVAEYERTPEEQARLEKARQKREEERRRREAEDDRTDEERLADVDDPTVTEPSEQEVALFNELMESARFAEAARKGEEERKRLAAAKRKAAEAKERGEGADEADGGTDGAEAPFEGLDAAYVRRVAPIFEDADLFAQFLVQWTMRAVAEKHPELPTTAEMWKSPVAIRELKQTATNILRRLAKDALGSPALNHARNFADHAINELESDAECRTFNAVRRQIAYVYDAIHDDALRMSRRKMVDRLVNGWRENNVTHPGIVQLAGAKGRFSATTEEFQRKIDGRTEMWARTVKRLVYMSEEKLAAYEAEREAIVNANPTAENLRDAPSPDKVKEVQDELVLARKYGGLIRKMPGEISAASEEILAILDGRLQEFEARRLEREERFATIRAAFLDAVNSGKAPRATGEKNKVVRFFESFQANVFLEIQNLVRYCTDPELRQRALDAIEELTVDITEGGTNYRNELYRCRTEIADGLKQAYGNEVKGIRHLKEPLPAEVADAIFSQRRDLAPTYGNLLQLYASAIQADYAENARRHGRDKQLKLMEDTLTDGDKAFHTWAVEWYREGRGSLSDAVEDVTGVPVTSPDPLYCPVKIDRPHDGFSAEVVAWSPIPRALSKRVPHALDFKESANFLDILMEEAEIRAQTIGYSALGIMLRDTLASREVQEAVRRNVGADDMKDVTDHLRDIVAGDAGRERDRTLDALNVARKWVARFAISGNISSAMMQPASIPVWANVMLGGEQLGLGRVFKYMTHVDRDAIRELVESGGAKARYDMGWSEEVQNMMMNPSAGRVLRAVEKVYDKGMVVSQFADRCSTLWVAQGFYRDAKARFLERGETAEEAKRKALALTWAAVEATQQTGRTEYLNRAQRGTSKVGKAVFQFRTAQLLANSYLIQALREVKAGTPGAKGRLARALAINAVVVPAYMVSVSALWAYLLGDEPPEEDESRWPELMREMAWSMVENTVAPLFVVNVLAEVGVKPLLGMQTYGQSSGVPAVDSTVRLFQHGSKAIQDATKWAAQNLTAMDYEEEVTIDKVMSDLMRIARDLAAPVRHGYKLYENRFAEEE